MLDNASVAGESAELQQCMATWRRLQEGGGGERWGRDWSLLAMAAADNTALCLEHYCDALARYVAGGGGGIAAHSCCCCLCCCLLACWLRHALRAAPCTHLLVPLSQLPWNPSPPHLPSIHPPDPSGRPIRSLPAPLCSLTQPAADSFAKQCSSVDKAYVANFGEEVVRSQPVFMLRWAGAAAAKLVIMIRSYSLFGRRGRET